MADTWDPQKRKQSAPLGAPSSAIDQSFFNAIKDLIVKAPEVAQELYNKNIELGKQELQNKFTRKGAFQTGAGLLFGGNNPVTSLITNNIAGGVYDVGAPIVSSAYQAMVENSDEYQQKQAEAAMRKAGVNPLAKEYASVGDYGVSDLPGTYESQVQGAINEAFARAAAKSNNEESAKQSKVDQALMEAISNEIGDYEVDDTVSTTPGISTKSQGWKTLGNQMQGIIDQNALNAQAGAIPGNYSPPTSSIVKNIEDTTIDTVVPNPFAGLPRTVPMTIDLSSIFNPATANDKDGGNDGHASEGGSGGGHSGSDYGGDGPDWSHGGKIPSAKRPADSGGK